jgi:transposase InsO family protein
MKYRFIYGHRDEHRIGKMCKTLEVSRSGYHKYIHQKMNGRRLENLRISEIIKDIFKKSHERYGCLKIRKELFFKGYIINKKRISRIMKINGLCAKAGKKYKVTTKSGNNATFAGNKVNQQFQVSRPNKIWVSDITYIWTEEGWLYLAIILDLFSRMIVGWSMSNRINAKLVTDAIEQAFMNREVEPGLIFHSDRGSQYTSKEVRKVLSAHECQQSMSAKGNCYDNAVAESFFHTLKVELIYSQKYLTRQSAVSSIFEYIEIFYNRERRHATLNYYSPTEFERMNHKLVA